MSIAGSVAKAVPRALSVGAEALQIFTRNQLRWQAKPLADGEVAAFRQAYVEGGLRFLCSHASYLINLASPSEDLRSRSQEALADEIRRADRLGCSCVVMHPGAPQSDGREIGLERVAAGVKHALHATAGSQVAVALENTSGQGSRLGSTVAELAELFDLLAGHSRVALCIDTCHGFAAGWNWRDSAEVRRLAEDIAAAVGLERLALFHLNDSKHPLFSARDNHEHIGRGHIGRLGFANVLAEPLFRGIPGILGTPKDEKTLAEDAMNLAALRALEPGVRRRIAKRVRTSDSTADLGGAVLSRKRRRRYGRSNDS
jgi:deoxyribonuclease-4